MAVTVVFDAVGMGQEQYDRVMDALAASGESEPEGRTIHVASENPSGMLVVDVWESPESFQRFAGALLPILQAAGVTPPDPKVLSTHNIVAG